MTKTILASLTGLSSDHTVLEAAVAMAKIDGGHIQCLHNRVDAVVTAALIGAASPRRHGSLQHVIQKLSEQEEERSRHAKTAFDGSIKRHSLTLCDTPEQGVSISVSWQESQTLLNETPDEARYYDVAIMAREEELSSERIIGVLMGSGRPVLLASPQPVQVIGRKVAIAWKAGAEAARAMVAASWIFAGAEHVSILSISEDEAGNDTDRVSAERLASQLQWQGIKADVRMRYAPSGSSSQAIRDGAYECDCDLLIMGAFGHSRMKEFIFGGVTRDILAECAIPVFMFR